MLEDTEIEKRHRSRSRKACDQGSIDDPDGNRYHVRGTGTVLQNMAGQIAVGSQSSADAEIQSELRKSEVGHEWNTMKTARDSNSSRSR